ncbi:LVIVD repeat-containing protein [Pyxidicoccus sp. MSG2]|uniref:LVIVD repeat-containing protein n=1 Tax=Pyxidicoccus sp. MSG2 TaxID=2996790 RepID=UPI0022718677|nr:hypothetical protein [Pyxidicoccus sp. MSG2]MCY1018873.1 hypothetical protein [Pyxidicoccus sp. MSG2]
MRQWTRSAWGLVLSGVLGVAAGCSGELVAPPLVKHEVTPWMVDDPDWEHTGPLAACKPAANAAVPCGAHESFDYSACNLPSLKGAKAGGLYTTHLLIDDTEPVFSTVNSLLVATDGGVSRHSTVVLPEQQLEDGRFFLGARSSRPDGGSTALVMVGCEASEDGLTLKGCYQQCRNGAQTFSGTFEAARVVRRQGESEASGLSLLSEMAVGEATPVDVYVTKGHAYVVSVPSLSRPGGLSVFDVSNARAPVLKKSISYPNDNYWNGVWAKDDALYVASADQGLLVFDISNPADPRFLRSLPGDEGGIEVHTVIVEGNRLYAMSPGPNVETLIFDVKDAKAPVLLTRFVAPGVATAANVTYPHDAFPFENRLYISHWESGYLIADVRDTEAVEVVGEYIVHEHSTSHTSRVMRQGQRLFAFEGGEHWGAHLRVLDVTDPAAVRIVGEYRLRPGVSIHNMELKGNRLYLSHYQEGVRVLDVTLPWQPREVGYYNTYQPEHPKAGYSFYDGAIGIRVPGDGHVYVIDTVRGLLILREG